MSISDLRRRLEPALRRVFHFYWRFSRGMTLGVRGLVIDAEGRVFLIKHTYVSGWHLPGGGVEVGETLREALARELVEEGDIEMTRTPEFYGMYLSAEASQRDHVALFVVEHFRQNAALKPNREILDRGFFARDALPEDATAGTRARIAEVIDGAAIAERW